MVIPARRKCASTSLRAKRSNPENDRQELDCFVALAPRNDDYPAAHKFFNEEYRP